MRQLESDTWDNNPALFHEYKSASANMRYIMDNQFKNLKTNARLSSKATWYEWRRKLLQDLKHGLVRIAKNMSKDDKSLAEQEDLLSAILPDLRRRNGQLTEEHEALETQVDEIANCDKAEMAATRASVLEVDNQIEEKRAMIEALQAEVREKQKIIETATERKLACLDDIKEAEAIREEYRGWRSSEVVAAKGGTCIRC
jgi:kinetochore protein Spc7/SPC105